jgi:hypothetical protein
MDYVCIEDKRPLLACPFEQVEKDCGHHPYVIKDDGQYYVQCTCGARGPMSPRMLEVEGWNTRAALSAPAADQKPCTLARHQRMMEKYPDRAKCPECGTVLIQAPAGVVDARYAGFYEQYAILEKAYCKVSETVHSRLHWTLNNLHEAGYFIGKRLSDKIPCLM